MIIKELTFFTYPTSVQKALSLLVAGWLSLIAFMYHINTIFPGKLTEDDAMRVVVVGVGICFFVLKLKPWAKNLCIFFNLGVIGVNIFFLYIRLSAMGWSEPGLTMHALINVALFIACTVYLVVKPTADFFQARVPKPADDHPASGA